MALPTKSINISSESSKSAFSQGNCSASFHLPESIESLFFTESWPLRLVRSFLGLVLLAVTTTAVGSDDSLRIEEIVVTATKKEQGLYDVPVSLSVLDGGTLGQRGISDLVDVGKHVPNLVVTTFSAGHTSSANPFIRGIGRQDHLITTDPGVGVYVDGVYLGRQVGQHWNLRNIERIEVLRGPQGTLYGRNSIGGAINIVTAAPGSSPGTRFTARLGTRSRKAASVHVDSDVSDTVGLSLSGSVDSRGGLGRFLNLPNVGIEVGETRELSSRIALAWDPTQSLSITLAADANDGENGLNPYTTLIDELPGGAVFAAGYRNTDISDDPYDNNTGQSEQAKTSNSARGLSVTADWEVNDWLSIRTIGSTRSSKYEAGLDDDGFQDDFLSFPETGRADQESVEVQFLGEFSDTDFVAGFYHFSEDGSNFQNPTVFLGFRGRFNLNQKLDSNAIFVNLSRNVSEQWRLSAGVRTTKDRKEASTNVGTGLVFADRSWRETSWELSAHYTLNDQLSAYGTLQSGYQSGEFPARPYCLFADPDCFTAGDNITARNQEVGIKGQPRDGLELAAALFRTTYDDLPYQVSTTQGSGFNTVNLIVQQTTTGFEFESTFHLTERFLTHVAVGNISIDLDEQAGVRPVAPLTPEWTLSIRPEYRRFLTSGAEVVAHLEYSYRDGMWGEPSSDPGRLTRIGSRTLVNCYIGYYSPNEDWNLGFYGHNVGDVRYDNARLNTGDYLLRILSNDASEFGLSFEKSF